MLHNADFHVLLRPIIRDYRQHSYDYWLDRIDADSITFGGCTAEGEPYQVEIDAHWDDQRDGDIRVCFAIDDLELTLINGAVAQMPYCEDFILGPDGNFVGE